MCHVSVMGQADFGEKVGVTRKKKKVIIIIKGRDGTHENNFQPVSQRIRTIAISL